MARAQRALYRAKVAQAVQDATAKKDHSEKVYTFIVDYGQNMELPSFNSEQPGCTYYFSPLTVFNLGVVNHAHTYNDGRVSEHMHAHLYHEGVADSPIINVDEKVSLGLSKVDDRFMIRGGLVIEHDLMRTGLCR